MEENREELVNPPQVEKLPQTPTYQPRPSWQVWAARIGLVIFIIILILYYGIMFSGGGK